MKEKAIAVYHAVTDIDPRYIQEAEAHRAKLLPTWTRWAAAAALAVLVLSLPLFLRMLGPAAAGEGGFPEDGYFAVYYGPVLPLTAQGNLEGLSADRELRYDFSPYESGSYTGTALVTDRYVLHNQTGQDKTLTLCYPLSGTLADRASSAFVCTVNGSAVEPAFHIGYPIPQTRQFADSWNEYRQLLEEPDLLRASLAPEPELTQTAIVYTLAEESPGAAAEDQVSLRFRIHPEQTAVFATGYIGYSIDEESGDMRVDFYVDRRETARREPCTLVLLGDDLEDPVLDSSVGSGGGSWRLDRQETSLARVLEEELRWDTEDPDASLSRTDSAALARLLEAALPVERRDGHRELISVTNLLSEVLNSSRVMYESLEVTVPAGGSLTVELRQGKKGSFQVGCWDSGGSGQVGYDLLTQAGSELVFPEQRASVTGLDHVELGDNNFGFDPENGITAVTLDPEIPCYWMRLRIK